MVELVTPTTKTELRAMLLQLRRATPREVRDTEAEALCRWLPGLVEAGQTVCAYVPVGSEPGSPALLDTLIALGARVLLPVARNGANGVPLPGPIPIVGGPVTLNHSQVTGNTATRGGGIFNSGGTVTLSATSVTGNNPDNCEPPGTIPGCTG